MDIFSEIEHLTVFEINIIMSWRITYKFQYFVDFYSRFR